MNVLGAIIRPMGECGIDSAGECVTSSPILPETAELIYGGLASLIIFFALYKFAWPQMKKALDARTARIQKELDDADAAESAATTEVAQIRKALGDIEAEVADLQAKATADIAAARGRSTDELRGEIARLSSAAVDHVVRGSLDDSTHQELIEGFIARVGAGS